MPFVTFVEYKGEERRVKLEDEKVHPHLPAESKDEYHQILHDLAMEKLEED